MAEITSYMFCWVTAKFVSPEKNQITGSLPPIWTCGFGAFHAASLSWVWGSSSNGHGSFCSSWIERISPQHQKISTCPFGLTCPHPLLVSDHVLCPRVRAHQLVPLWS